MLRIVETSTLSAREHENYQITQDYGKEFIFILVDFLAIKRPQEESTINSTLLLWKC